MPRDNDEFNHVKISNEEEKFSFEFGSTPKGESTSYVDNRDQIHDEVNDNPTKNDENKSPEKEERRKQEKQRGNESKESKENSNGSGSEGSSSAGGGARTASSASATVATVAGAALVSVTTLSTLVGINLFFAGRCQMNQFDVTHESLVYELELTEIGEDNCVIKLENADIEFNEEQNLIEGVNSGHFTDLTPNTNYHVSVVDLTYENFVLFEQNIKTLSKDVETYVVTFITNGGSSVETQLIAEGGVVIEPTAPTKDGCNFGGWYVDAELTQKYDFATAVTKDIFLYAGWIEAIFYTVTFESNGGSGTMGSLELDANSEYSLPVCIFVPSNDVYFGGWQINGEGDIHQPGETIVVNSDTTLVAQWTKFPTQENTVDANSNDFFYLFPEQPSNDIDTITLMGIDFLYKNTYYSPNSQSLNIVNYAATNADGFISTTTPFDGPISSIAINTSEFQFGDVDFTMVYSASPIYEKVTDQGETHTLAAGSTYSFECTNPDARYFCLSNAVNLEAFISSMKFVYNTPIIENSFNIYFDANGGSGEFGPYTVRNLNKRELPDIDSIGFVAPEGYEFAGWKVKSVEDLLNAGTVIGISSDITLVAQWKEKGPYTVTFDTNGGSEVAPQEVTEGEYATRPANPSKSGFEFIEWCYMEEDQPYTYIFEEMPVESDITLYAQWQPITTLSFHVDYIDMSQGLLSYTYSINNADDYKGFVLRFYCDGEQLEEYLLLNLDNTPTDSAFATIELPREVLVAIRADENEVVDYHVFGTSQIGQEEYTTDIAKGSFSSTRSVREKFNDVIFGNTTIDDQMTNLPLIYTGGNYFLPVFVDMIDFNNQTYGDRININYTVDGDEYSSDFRLDGGMKLVYLNVGDYYTANGVSFDSIVVQDTNGETLVESTFPKTGVIADAGQIFGFSLSTFSSSSNPQIQIVGMPYDSNDETYRGLGMNSVKLFFDVLTDTSKERYAVDLDLSQNDTPLGQYIEFEMENYEKLLKAMENHVVTVTLAYENASGETITFSDFYIQYSFQIYD